MALERQLDPNAPKPITLNPCLVAVAALILYGLTLNHWVTLSSLSLTAKLTGWDWHPRMLLWRPNTELPLFYLLTLPLRVLPVSWRPMGLNIFTAVCAAVTLAILARSVRLFPHDRTKEQRQREGGEFALLSMRFAFLPATFAVMMLAAQLGFWSNATSATGEMIDLMVFSFLILCLLQYRLSLNERWLHVLALVYGLGMTNNWALISFSPCFLVAVIWIRGMSFFQLGFLLRMLGWGALGLSLYLLMPVMGAAAHDAGFWDILHSELGDQSYVLRIYPRAVVLVAWSLILVPVIFASVKWPSFEAEVSPMAHDLTRGMFRLMHVILLVFISLMFFNLKFSPKPEKMHLPGFMTFYYLAALCIGYYSGYILLVFGRDVTYRWGQARGLLRGVNKATAGLLWVAAFGVPILLVCQNYHHVQLLNGDVLPQFGDAMTRAFPAKAPGKQTLVLADDPMRLALAQAASEREGKGDQYIFFDSRAMNHREYYAYLEDRYPQLQKLFTNAASMPPLLDSSQIADLIADLARHQQVYYLQPSMGYFFEEVYMVPHGLGGDLKPYQNMREELEMPALLPAQITRNEAFWKDLRKGPLMSLTNLNELNADTVRVGIYYSQSLNYWGTELQKAATISQTNLTMLAEAADQFDDAIRLNADNYLARVNLRYNATLRGIPPPPGSLINLQSLVSRVGSWTALIDIDGPVDMPELNRIIGQQMAMSGDYSQGIHLFLRSLQMTRNPADMADIQLDIAKTEVDMRLYDEALGLIDMIRKETSRPPDDLVRVEALAYTKKGDFAKAEQILVDAQRKNPNDANFLGVMVEFYRVMGYSALRQAGNDAKKAQAAQHWFTAALTALQQQLQLLYRSTAYTADIPEVLRREAELQMLLEKYNDATATLTESLKLAPENTVALVNRAISEFRAGKLAEAKTDYLAVEKLIPHESFVVYYGLIQIAQKQNDNAAEMRYGKLYLKLAPQKTTEYAEVSQQLQKLGVH